MVSLVEFICLELQLSKLFFFFEGTAWTEKDVTSTCGISSILTYILVKVSLVEFLCLELQPSKILFFPLKVLLGQKNMPKVSSS